jgi:hypothetical protein
MERLKKVTVCLPLFSLLLPKVTLAASVIVDPTAGPISSATAVTDLINRLSAIISSLAGIIAFLVIGYGSYLYATSGGDKEKASKGRVVLFYGLGGALLIILSTALVKVFITILGGTAI